MTDIPGERPTPPRNEERGNAEGEMGDAQSELQIDPEHNTQDTGHLDLDPRLTGEEMTAADLPESQGHDPLIAEQGDDGEGDLSPQDT